MFDSAKRTTFVCLLTAVMAAVMAVPLPAHAATGTGIAVSGNVLDNIGLLVNKLGAVADVAVDVAGDAAWGAEKGYKLVRNSAKVARVVPKIPGEWNQVLGKAVNNSPVLKTLFKNQYAFQAILGAVQATPEVIDAYQEYGVGGLVSEAVYQAVRIGAKLGAAYGGTTGGAALGTFIAGPVGTVGVGILGGMVASEVAGLAVDYAFLDEVKASYLFGTIKFSFSGLDLKTTIRNAINQPGGTLEVVDQRDWLENVVLSDLQQRFTNSGFLTTAASGTVGIGGTGLIRAQLVWYNSADLDLHMRLPDGAGEVYYGDKTISFNSGNTTAELDHDNLGGVIDVQPNKRVENITVTGVDVPAGTYEVWAHVFNPNGNASMAYELITTGDAAQNTQTQSGTFTADGQVSSTINVTSLGGSF